MAIFSIKRSVRAIRTLPSFLLALTFGGIIVAEPAWATIDNLKSFKEAYPDKEPKAYSCKVCHTNAMGRKGDLNAYGKALEALKGAGNAKKLTVDDYRAVETQDADADTASNGDELAAGTNPADPASVPPPAPADSSTPVAAPEPAGTIEEPSAAPQPSVPASGEKPSSRHPAFPQVHAYLNSLVAGQEAWADTPKPEADYVGTETCAACHAKEFSEFTKSTHSRISVPGVLKMQGCEMCHGPGSLHVEAGGGRGVGGIVNPSKNPEACFACHMDKKAEIRLPHHHPILEGKMSCTDCHSPHGDDVRPWSSTTMKDINEACFKCHKEQRGPFVWEHEALREGCTTCHKVHGSIHEKMLVARDNNLCLRCHTQVGFPTIGKSSHAARLQQGTCFSAGCHTAVHGSNFDDHLRY